MNALRGTLVLAEVSTPTLPAKKVTQSSFRFPPIQSQSGEPELVVVPLNAEDKISNKNVDYWYDDDEVCDVIDKMRIDNGIDRMEPHEKHRILVPPYR
jgi:hypothetical protein